MRQGTEGRGRIGEGQDPRGRSAGHRPQDRLRGRLPADPGDLRCGGHGDVRGGAPPAGASRRRLQGAPDAARRPSGSPPVVLRCGRGRGHDQAPGRAYVLQIRHRHRHDARQPQPSLCVPGFRGQGGAEGQGPGAHRRRGAVGDGPQGVRRQDAHRPGRSLLQPEAGRREA